MTDFAALIAKLEVWSEHELHADRQLSDEVLIADGWTCEPDAAWEGGIRWSYGTNPRYSTTEASRPHLIHDLGAAIAVVPFGYLWHLSAHPGGTFEARVTDPAGTAFDGRSTEATVAVLIAAVKALQARGAS